MDEMMLVRREFLKSMIAAAFGIASFENPAFALDSKAFQGEQVFKRILKQAIRWSELPIGKLMGKIAMELKGTPYKAKTLDLSVDREICSVNLNGLDCVTFFETTLDFARMIKKGGRTPQDLLKEIEFTRYRGGTARDFASRLHYTSDWFFDNQVKHAVKILDNLPGTKPFTQHVDFMSTHPESYPHLVSKPALIKEIKRSENMINGRSMKFVPMDKIASVEALLQTGDIVGVCTSLPGLDIVHTGLIVCDESGARQFMNASSAKSLYQVTISPQPLTAALSWSTTNTGAMFARPLNPGEAD